MLNLGIVDNKKKLYLKLNKHFQSDRYRLTVINEKKHIYKIDGLIIPMYKKEQLAPIIDWIVTCKAVSNIFIWVFSEIPLEYEKDIFTELGVKEVFMSDTCFHCFGLLIKKTLSKLEKNTDKKNTTEQLINKEDQTVFINGTGRNLTCKEYHILTILYEHKNRLVSYQTLMKKVWPNQPQEHYFLLMNVISHLREKISDNPMFKIKTFRSQGYMLQEKKD